MIASEMQVYVFKKDNTTELAGNKYNVKDPTRETIIFQKIFTECLLGNENQCMESCVGEQNDTRCAKISSLFVNNVVYSCTKTPLNSYLPSLLTVHTRNILYQCIINYIDNATESQCSKCRREVRSNTLQNHIKVCALRSVEYATFLGAPLNVKNPYQDMWKVLSLSEWKHLYPYDPNMFVKVRPVLYCAIPNLLPGSLCTSLWNFKKNTPSNLGRKRALELQPTIKIPLKKNKV